MQIAPPAKAEGGVEAAALLEARIAALEPETAEALEGLLQRRLGAHALQRHLEAWRAAEVWRSRLEGEARHGGRGRAPTETELAAAIGRRWRRLAGRTGKGAAEAVRWSGIDVVVGAHALRTIHHPPQGRGAGRRRSEARTLGAATAGEVGALQRRARGRTAPCAGGGGGAQAWSGLMEALCRHLAGRIEHTPEGVRLVVPARGGVPRSGQVASCTPGAVEVGATERWRIDREGRLGRRREGALEPLEGRRLASLAIPVGEAAREEEVRLLAELCGASREEAQAALEEHCAAHAEALAGALAGPLDALVEGLGMNALDVPIGVWLQIGEGVEGGRRRRERMRRHPLWGRRMLDPEGEEQGLADQLLRADRNEPDATLMDGTGAMPWAEAERGLGVLRDAMVAGEGQDGGSPRPEGALQRAVAVEVLTAVREVSPATIRGLEQRLAPIRSGPWEGWLVDQEWVGDLALDPRRWRTLLRTDARRLGEATRMLAALQLDRQWDARTVAWVDAVWADPAGAGAPGAVQRLHLTWRDTVRAVVQAWIAWAIREAPGVGHLEERSPSISRLTGILLARPPEAVMPLVRRLDATVHAEAWRRASLGGAEEGAPPAGRPPGWSRAAAALSATGTEAQHLDDAAALGAEGERMRHCIGGWEAHRRAESLTCVHLEGTWGEATATYRWIPGEGEVPRPHLVLCLGPGNDPVHADGRTAAARLEEYLAEAFRSRPMGERREYAAALREAAEAARAEVAGGTHADAVRMWEEGVTDERVRRGLEVLDPRRYAPTPGGAAEALAIWTAAGGRR